MDYKDGEMKICVISVWFGSLPSYLPYFLKTCAANRYLNWLLISDQQLPVIRFKNIKVMIMSRESFDNLASKQLGFEVKIDDPYKVCDFKPIFGKIFQDHLKPYRYWGYCDLDIVFGNISKQIQALLPDNPDVISFYHGFLSGPFCLYRNTPAVIDLFSQVPGHKSILHNKEHKAFDEHIPKRVASFKILYYRIRYFLKFVFAGPRYNLRSKEIRYQFQWYAKKLNSRRSPPSDMTDIVHKASRTGQIKVVFRNLIRSDRAFIRQRRNSWKLSWIDGMLTDTRNGKELFAFHFVDSKTDPEYIVEPMEDHTDKFSITERGIDCLLHEKTGK